MHAIEVEGVVKRYGDTLAVDGLHLTVETGEIFGILGRNGAGKTTTVEAIAGLRKPDAGAIRVLGLDPQRDRGALRQILGVQLQQARLHDTLKVHELLTLFRSFYRRGREPEELLEQLGLTEQRSRAFQELSGGQQQRLSIALALVGGPRVVILDELTTGLDPEARRSIWALIRTIREQEVTVVLVSHSMDEVEHLCDRAVILDAGTVLAEGTPEELVAAGGPGSRNLEDAFLNLTGQDGTRPHAGGDR